jgi:hypothetical protein
MSFYLMVFQGAGAGPRPDAGRPGAGRHPVPGGRAWHDASDPGRVLEEFVVASWDDHLRQHERVTKREQAHLERVRELTDPDHPRRRHPLAGRQLAQATRISGQADVTAAAS